MPSECLDCGKPIARTKIRCAACRDLSGKYESRGYEQALHRCADCDRPILFTKELCGPCGWKRHMAERRGEARP